jgi:large subunit ribosomal protein L10
MVQTTKIETVEQTRERLSRAQSVVVVQYQGMTVAQLRELRRQLREVDSELKVIKNRLVKRALADNGFDALDSSLTGPTALAFGYGDPTAPSKVCTKYAKTNDKLVIRGGLLGNKALDLKAVDALSRMPGRLELLAQMATVLKAPARQMATALNQAMAKVVYAMKDRASQLEGGSSEAAAEQPAAE